MNHWAQIKTAVLQMPKCICVFITRQCLSSINEKSHIFAIWKRSLMILVKGWEKKAAFTDFTNIPTDSQSTFILRQTICYLYKRFTQHNNTVISFHWSTNAPPPPSPSPSFSRISHPHWGWTRSHAVMRERRFWPGFGCTCTSWDGLITEPLSLHQHWAAL